MKKMLLLLLGCMALQGYAQSRRLSDQATISVITCAPWQGELYSAFGHSAFRVHDPALGLDDAYNYGIFDFDQPNFYLNFARGYMYYQLGAYPYERFKVPYIYHNRYIHEQELNLTPEQKQKVFDYLEWNTLPENEHYRYDYFYDNCATKMPGVLIKALGNSIAFDDKHITTHYSIRELTDLYLHRQPWGDLGIDVCLGSEIDREAPPFDYMFLPEYVEQGLDHATVKHGDQWVPLVQKKNIVYAPREEDPVKGLPHPLYVFSALALVAIILSVVDLRRKTLSTWWDVLLFGAAGLIGVLLFLLWFATDHKSSYNYNLLWALPSHVVAVFAFIRQPRWLKTYFLLTAVVLVVTLVSWPVLPQKLNTSLIPVVIALAVRAFTQYRIRQARA
ncbi:Lnb N-terminal periplasmic domain-containing protein [Dawidia soli]|uniref:DUF4105 domain-containing protein n=1 Tax=Dawidia soli TaxID=2782352 RepID=A0AAP2DAB4_9BACT|nr:DUF4105 domain-containing protein [Dawidia soli]MBT1687401.1 DUF4105 domain-containing protein [Dawidia soli]